MSSRAATILRTILRFCLLLFLTSSFRYAQAYAMHAVFSAPLATTRPKVANSARFRDHPAYENIRNTTARKAKPTGVASNTGLAALTKANTASQGPSISPAANNSAAPANPQSVPTVQPVSVPVRVPEKQNSHGGAQENLEIIKAKQLLSSRQQQSAGNSAQGCFLQERQHLDGQMFEALNKVLAGDKSILREHYFLDFETEQLLQKNNIDVKDFTHCSGNAAAQQKHREIIIILNKISDLHDTLSMRDAHTASSSFGDIFYHFLDAASLSNKQGLLFASSRITDFSWAGLEYLYAAAHGAKTGGLNIFYALSDPVGTGTHMIQAGQELGRFLGHFCAEMVALQAHMSYQEVCALNNLKPDDSLGNFTALKARLRATQSLGTILERALKDFANKSGPERVCLLAEVGTEYFLTGPAAHKIAQGASLLCARAAKQAKNIMRAIKKGERFEHAVAAAGGFELPIARETLAFFDNAGEAMPKGPSAGQAIGSTHRFSSSAINEAVECFFRDENKVGHVFKNAQHNFDPLVESLGGRKNVVKAVFEAANGKLPSNGLFSDIPVIVGDKTVYVRGRVMDGVLRIGTMFIK
jgi:hypothetical protein